MPLTALCFMFLTACSVSGKKDISSVSTQAIQEQHSRESTPDESISSSEERELAQYPALGVRADWPELLIAGDFMQALSQVPGYEPESTIISLPPARTDFDLAIEQALVDFGYRVARIERRSGRGVLMTSHLIAESQEKEKLTTYMLAIDRIAMKRSFSTRDNVVAPSSSLFVRGVPPEAITLNDAVFVQDKTNQ